MKPIQKTRALQLACSLALASLFSLAGCSTDNPGAPGADGNLKAFDGLGDRVWHDANADGIQDEGEFGVADVLVTLQDCAGASVAADTTDADGYYLISGIDSGDYRVHFDLPTGYAFTLQGAGTDTTIDSDVDPVTGLTMCLALADTMVELGIDAGLTMLPTTGSLGDRVWHDANNNGIQDAGETGLMGVVVELTDCGGFRVMSDTTDAAGGYLFADIEAGDYQVHVVLPDSFAFAPMHADTTADLDSDFDPATGLTGCLTIAAGMADLDVDAGLYMPFLGTGCAHGHGYWKNHLDEVEPMLPLTLGDEGGAMSRVVDSTEVAHAVLQQHTWGHPSNGITKLYTKLLTAKINVANGADGSRAAEAMAAADAFLADHDWTDWENLCRDDRRMVQRMLGSFHVVSVGDNCGDDHDHDGDCGGDDDDDDDDDGHGGGDDDNGWDS